MFPRVMPVGNSPSASSASATSQSKSCISMASTFVELFNYTYDPEGSYSYRSCEHLAFGNYNG